QAVKQRAAGANTCNAKRPCCKRERRNPSLNSKISPAISRATAVKQFARLHRLRSLAWSGRRHSWCRAGNAKLSSPLRLIMRSAGATAIASNALVPGRLIRSSHRSELKRLEGENEHASEDRSVRIE